MRINHNAPKHSTSGSLLKEIAQKVEDRMYCKEAEEPIRLKQICIPVVNPNQAGMLKCPGCNVYMRVNKGEQ
jgi:hypothetical protein